MPQPHHSIETADSESLSSYDRDSNHSTSTTGEPTLPMCLSHSICVCVTTHIYTYISMSPFVGFACRLSTVA